MRLSLALIVIAATLASPAQAETDWSKYKTFVSTRCEDAATIADIKESMKGLTFDEGGASTFGTASKVKIVQSKTIKATADTLVCLLKMQTIEAGDTYAYSARHTVTIEPDGSWKTKYMPNY